MGDLANTAKNVKTKEDFIEFLSVLIDDLAADKGIWENRNLEQYLSAMQRWTEDMEGYYINNNLLVPENINWKIFTDILMAARIYE